MGKQVGCRQHSGSAGVGRQSAPKGEETLDAKATRDVVTDYLAWQVVVNGGDSILEALDLEAQYQISSWDALVIQAAHVAGAEILYSEDLSDGQRYRMVRVKNPLTRGDCMEQGHWKQLHDSPHGSREDGGCNVARC